MTGRKQLVSNFVHHCVGVRDEDNVKYWSQSFQATTNSTRCLQFKTKNIKTTAVFQDLRLFKYKYNIQCLLSSHEQPETDVNINDQNNNNKTGKTYSKLHWHSSLILSKEHDIYIYWNILITIKTPKTGKATLNLSFCSYSLKGTRQIVSSLHR